MKALELILKQPQDKLPFLGILFESSFDGERVNQSIVNSYKTYLYNLELEPIDDDKMNITIREEKMNFKYTYQNVKFDAEKLSKFLQFNKDATLFNFSHIKQEYDKHIVLKTSVNRALYVLKVKEVKLVSDIN